MSPDTATALSTAYGLGSLLVLLGLCCYLEMTLKK